MNWRFELSDCPKNPEYPIVATQTNDSGVNKGPFYISIEQMIQALKQEPENNHDAEELRKRETSTPTLPFGTIRYSVNGDKTQERVTMVIPKKQWDIRYGDDEHTFYNIGFPRLVIQYLIQSFDGQEKRMTETRLYAIQDDNKPITDETPLFPFPYPNVGKTNGIVCWGRNARLEIKSLVELERTFGWFVAAPFNEDHGVRTTLGIDNFRILIERIQEQPFDDEWLIPSKKTFGSLFINED